MMEIVENAQGNRRSSDPVHDILALHALHSGYVNTNQYFALCFTRVPLQNVKGHRQLRKIYHEYKGIGR